MQLGIHLPHAGEQATPALIRRHAIRAEALGFADVWVSEHIIVPRKQFPRSPLFYDPVVTLTWAAAVTERVRLGTTRAGAADAPSAAAGEGTGDAAQPVGRPADPGRRRRLAGGGIRRARRAVQGTRPAHGRRHRDDARGVDAGPGDLRGEIHPGEDRRDDDAAAADESDPAVDRRQFGCGVEAHDPHRRWLARQPETPESRADRQAAARRAAGRGFHHLDARAVERQGSRACCATCWPPTRRSACSTC